MIDKQKQIEEMANIIFDGRYKNDYISPLKGANELYNAGYRKIPENAVVLTREEYDYLINDCKRWENLAVEKVDEIITTRKETAEKFARLVEFHSVSTRDEEGIEIFTISALGLKEILHEEFGILYDEICKEITEGK